MIRTTTLRSLTAHCAFFCCLVLVHAGCAAEKLEARDPQRGPAGDQRQASPIAHPTDLQATEQQAPPAPLPAPSEQESYACPMHPEVQSAHPGSCPKCGMTLQRKRLP